MRITIDTTEFTNEELVELYKLIPQPVQPNHKSCSKCKEVKSSELFFKDARKKSGLMPQCKECYYKSRDNKKKVDSQKKWREQNPGYLKTWSQTNKEKLKEYRKVFLEKNPNYYKEYSQKKLNKSFVVSE